MLFPQSGFCAVADFPANLLTWRASEATFFPTALVSRRVTRGEWKSGGFRGHQGEKTCRAMDCVRPGIRGPSSPGFGAIQNAQASLAEIGSFHTIPGGLTFKRYKRSESILRRCVNRRRIVDRLWFRDLDSNQDFRLQRPTCYRLHHPGTG